MRLPRWAIGVAVAAFAAAWFVFVADVLRPALAQVVDRILLLALQTDGTASTTGDYALTVKGVDTSGNYQFLSVNADGAAAASGEVGLTVQGVDSSSNYQFLQVDTDGSPLVALDTHTRSRFTSDGAINGGSAALIAAIQVTCAGAACVPVIRANASPCGSGASQITLEGITAETKMWFLPPSSETSCVDMDGNTTEVNVWWR